MKLVTYVLSDVHTYAANTTTRVDIPRNGYITHIDARLLCQIQAGSSVVPPTSPSPDDTIDDDLARLIHSFSIKGSGGKVYFDVSDGRQWFWLTWMKYQGQVQASSLPSASDTTGYQYMQFACHWGLEPQNYLDRSIVLPARDMANLTSELTWGQASDIGTGYTVNSAVLTLNITELVLEEGELKEKAFPGGIMRPRYESRINTPGATNSNISLEENFPVGDTVYEVLIMQLDNSFANRPLDNRISHRSAVTGTLTPSTVREIAVKYPKLREEPLRLDTDALEMVMRSRYGLPVTPTGVYLIKMSDLTGKEAGLDLSLSQVGDAKLGFSIDNANRDIHILFYAFSS